MRPVLAGVALSVAVLVPNLGNAQVYLLPTPPPQVSAASEPWYYNGEPVFYEGDFYFPTGPTVYFDGNVMKRSGVYRGVPLYVDATLTPYSIVYVPTGGNVMRPYERKRAGELAGTTGSKPPSFPIQRDVELLASGGAVGIQTPPIGPSEVPYVPEAIRVQTATANVVGTFSASGTFATGAADQMPAPQLSAPERHQPQHIVSIPPPRSNEGLWIEFSGARWYSAGAAVPFVADRFTPIGEYHGFPVYRERGGSDNRIFVPSVIDGPLSPYRR